ncbi:MAG: class E sortase [Actinomycetota bacterium]|nr:class E sortase [Actinomycetota bacterium]
MSWVVSLLMIVAGVALVATFFFGRSLQDPATNAQDPGGFNVPQLEYDSQATSKDAAGPKDKSLKLTVPDMSRVDGVDIPQASGSDTEALDSNAAIHLEGTGYPWEEEANVYVAGHRLGYPNTKSFLAFFDLNNLEDGDEVFVEDADGTKYTYKVFKEVTVSPTDISVTRPVEGKNILTLQTCTLPDYSDRLIVQAELVDKEA